MQARLSPIERDLLIRTVIGEAANQSDEGREAVAAVALNRLRSGKFGDNMANVLFAKNQFEPWTTRSKELLSYNADDPAYVAAASATDAAINGGDPTAGATHFLNPKVVNERYGHLPNWASGEAQVIGDHTFYAPEGRVTQVADNEASQEGGFSDDSLEKLLLGDEPQPPTTPGASGSSAPAEMGDDQLEKLLLGSGTTETPTDVISKAPNVLAAPPEAGNAVDAFLGGVLNGVPVAGPLLRGGSERLGAVGRTLRSGGSYDKNLEAIQNEDEAQSAAHPVENFAGEITGGIGTFAAGGATTLGAKLLGTVGKNVAERAGMAAMSGAAIGGADSAVRSGGDIDETGKGAAFGALLGGLGPAAGEVIGGAARKVTSLFKAPTAKAAAERSITRAIEEEGGNPAAVSSALAANPRLAPMDVDTNLLLRAMGIAAQPGEGRAVLDAAIKRRMAEAPVAVQSAYDAALGGTPDVKVLLEGLQATARKNAKAGFGAALNGAKPVDISGVLSAIDNKLTPGVAAIASPGSTLPQGPVEQALGRVKAMLTNGRETLTDAERLHTIQSQLRVEAETLGKSANGQDRLVASALRDVRGKINDAIDGATGGKFKAAQAQYADDISVQDAFDKGLEAFRNRAGANGLEDRPEYWRDWVKNASPDELQALRQGMRVAVDQQINSVRAAARKGAALPEIGFNKEKLTAVLGAPEAEKLATLMADEAKIAATNNKVMEGSMTAMRESAKEATRVKSSFIPEGFGPLPVVGGVVAGAPGAAIGTAAEAVKIGTKLTGRKIIEAAHRKRNAIMAKLLSGSQADFDEAVEGVLAAERRRASAAGFIGQGSQLMLQGSSRPLEITVDRYNNQPAAAP